MGYKKNFFKEFLSLKEVIAKEKNKEAATVWLEIKELLLTGKYSNYRKTKELAELILNGYVDSAISIKLNVDENTVRTNKRTLSNELYSIFGEDFIDLFQNFNKNRSLINKRIILAKANFSGGASYIANQLPIDVVSLLRGYSLEEGVITSFNIEDCKKELQFLGRFCIKNIQKELSELDPAKVAYIFKLINEGGNPDDCYEIYRRLS